MPILDVRLILMHTSFPLASHLTVSSDAVRVIFTGIDTRSRNLTYIAPDLTWSAPCFLYLCTLANYLTTGGNGTAILSTPVGGTQVT